MQIINNYGHIVGTAHYHIILISKNCKTDRKQLNIFERKVYRIILGPVYDNEKENWRIL
jgi:hypothetical protein